MEWLSKVLRELPKDFFGTLTISFQKGKITVIKKAQTLKPPG